jgi:hypothetical protein
MSVSYHSKPIKVTHIGNISIYATEHLNSLPVEEYIMQHAINLTDITHSSKELAKLRGLSKSCANCPAFSAKTEKCATHNKKVHSYNICIYHNKRVLKG